LMVSFLCLINLSRAKPGEIPAELFVVDLGAVLLFFM